MATSQAVRTSLMRLIVHGMILIAKMSGVGSGTLKRRTAPTIQSQENMV